MGTSARGEDRSARWLSARASGVPPLARRGPHQVGTADVLRRGTSARAERTYPTSTAPPPPPGYLRLRGEDLPRTGMSRPMSGVPPLARRGPAGVVAERVRQRGTSARAERTEAARSPGRRATGYLRSRGEDLPRTGRARCGRGVPPLARRGRSPMPPARWYHRGTSARAERTGSSATTAGLGAGYLRSRGEDDTPAPPTSTPSGVPPLARRGLCPCIPVQGHPRGTSARAERTRELGAPGRLAPGYLRSRGEDGPGPAAPRTAGGVPPLARRGRSWARRWCARRRGTSARAERTSCRLLGSSRTTGYLRSRGEDRCRRRRGRPSLGVPPLARRGPHGGRALPRRQRGTSARAERTEVHRPRRPPPSGYLRSRGEDVGRTSTVTRMGGVPPLARRGQGAPATGRGLVRGTSARAERTSTPPSTAAAATGYLRSRGEDQKAALYVGAAVGVPPLARRGPDSLRREINRQRGTSARAERTWVALYRYARAEGYLRSRGEDDWVSISPYLKDGVPPLARRGPKADIRGHNRNWGTSARAERTRHVGGRLGLVAGYLRSRGEDSAASFRAWMRSGVPPLARRGRHHPRAGPPRRRGTSARAERTRSPSTAPGSPTGYLRSRGEDAQAVRESIEDGGVPPLARRGLLAAVSLSVGGRGTSARAERTAATPALAGHRPGYLRSRGEDRPTTGVTMYPVGVPPLARRGPLHRQHPADVRRGTSARAERTPRGPGRWPAPPGYLRSRGEDPS